MIKRILSAILLAALALGSAGCGNTGQTTTESTSYPRVSISSAIEAMISPGNEDIGEYRYAEYEVFNSYAYENGLDNTLIYFTATVQDVIDLNGVYLLEAYTDDGNWIVSVGSEDVSDFTLLEKTFPAGHPCNHFCEIYRLFRCIQPARLFY